MRHRKNFNHLGRQTGHRKAMLANMANSLILHKRITTTTAKAKALRCFVEPLITKSKDDSTHSRRIVFSHLQDKVAVSELFREISPKISDRPGGYTRILKTGTRLGDSADMCIIELVDYNENMLSTKDAKGKASRKRRRSGASSKEKTESTPVAKVKESTVVEDNTEISDIIEEIPEAKIETEEPKAEESSTEESTDEK
jgi:large subunit ribosomal protein L17